MIAASRVPAETTTDLGILPSELAPRIGARATIGLVVLATDQTLEHEFRTLLGLPGVAFYEARLFSDFDITSETLRAIGPRIAPCTDLILPGLPIDVVAFGCTSATMTLGEDYVFDEIRKVRPGVACTTPVTAALAAFKALGVRRIGLLTPYAPSINTGLARYFESRGLEVPARATFNRQDDREAALISVPSIEAAAERLAAEPGVEAVFVSCTSLRVAEAVARIEARSGIPVTSSNHAMAWHCLRLAGVNDARPDAGRLFALSSPTSA
ncbi:maleate cis-trans isomerase family protein [Ancylobacter lacus]|uniref:maleate cis-trans isomerase family protein n=1 Tax=Ancylobacter lacus TaxID=2579970 RepID=UPI001BD08294|nr:aspartate/glutamate racemase family protein [Ancylobacter lacus]MBS7537384.1 aspartate/glutamate racemase family protein [Ancylobacter lacus]